MLDYVCVFTKAGLVLWSKTLCKMKNGNPVHALVSTVLLEEKGADRQHVIDSYALQWTFVNELDLVFVAVYQRTLQLLYVGELLRMIAKDFTAAYREELTTSKPLDPAVFTFDERFERLYREAQDKAVRNKKQQSSRNLSAGNGTKQDSRSANVGSGGGGSGGSSDGGDGSGEEDETGEGGNDQEGGEGEDGEGADGGAVLTGEEKAKLLRQRSSRTSMRARKATGAASGASGPPAAPASEADNTSKKRTGKQMRVWHDGTGKMSAKAMASLDRSNSSQNMGDVNLAEVRATYLPDEGETPQWREDEESKETLDSDVEEQENGSGSGSSSASSSSWNFSKTYLGSMLQSLTGNKVLEADDLQPVLDTMKQNLMAKNVAAEIAEDICLSVRNSLEGKKLASMTRISTVVKQALEDAVLRVLTPARSTDILREALDAKAAGRPYTVVFVGVNGVGKSTSLAKVCYYLKDHGLSVLLAACDTFRSGAVEQLRVHSMCLDAPLFDQGYARDPSRVAAAAIQHARDNKYDVVLVDTAGRMQNNEPLMRALATLVADNSPDLVLFVGEALVGNDGIDQLSMFNQALVNYSPVGKIHQIDGIVLTKFDTIDDKVGAALSMAYKSGRPIMFIGMGQKYTHLKKLNVASVVKALFN